MLTDETRYRILKTLQADPQASQRRIADELGISLGRVNYCLNALINKGLVKVNNFRNSSNKRAYLYLLHAARHRRARHGSQRDSCASSWTSTRS